MFQSFTSQLSQFRQLHPLRWRLSVVVAVPIALCLVLVIGVSLVFAGRIYPGVTLDGVAVGGLNKAEAQAALDQAAKAYSTQAIPVRYGNTTLRMTPANLGVSYDAGSVEAAMDYGRSGNLFQQMKQRLARVIAAPVNVERFNFSDPRLAAYLNQIGDDVTTPVANASLAMSGSDVAVAPSQPGQRLDTGYLVASLQNRLGYMSTAPIVAPVYGLPASIDEARLAPAQKQATEILSGPLQLKIGSKNVEVPPTEIINWIQISGTTNSLAKGVSLTGFYPTIGTVGAATLGIDAARVKAYVAGLAGQIDQPGKNAQLGVQDGKVVVTAPSQNGLQLDQVTATAAILRVLEKPGANRKLTLNARETKPEVNEGNLASLGLVEQISQGQTFFPGSPATRLINVRTGAAKMEDVLIKPGEAFSFNKALGPITPEAGYVPELVILENHEEKQYGGGLCQVSSTVYRAALAAGLPILQRVNHAFAISYYTAPYGVPGVDATIYPDSGVDMRFRNDTGHYILMQSIMQGTTLTVNFYGTKTKTGVIRGPEFVTGSTNEKEPSHTRFYRDVVDLSGKVTKTDTIDTFYKASTDFPVTQQIN